MAVVEFAPVNVNARSFHLDCGGCFAIGVDIVRVDLIGMVDALDGSHACHQKKFVVCAELMAVLVVGGDLVIHIGVAGGIDD